MNLSIASQKVIHFWDAPLTASLTARWSLFIRAFWLVYVVCLYGLAIVGTVSGFIQYLTICDGAHCLPNQMTTAGLQTLHANGLSLEFYMTYITLVSMLVPLTGLPLSTLLVLRRPYEPMALLFAFVVGSCAAFTTGGLSIMERAYPNLWLPLRLVDYVVFAGFPCLFFLFPDGHWTPRWTRWLGLATLVIMLLTFFPTLTAPNSVGKSLMQFWSLGSWLIMFGAQLYRYRHTQNPVHRQQIKWIAFGVGVIAAWIIVTIPLRIAFPTGPAQGSLVELALYTASGLVIAACLSSIGFAVLRYRLFDIDVLINRTLVYGALTASVIGVYVLLVGGLGTLFAGRGQVTSPLQLLATGIIAVAFQPLRARLQRAVNRLMYGERDEPYAVLSRLGQQLETTLAPGAVLPTIAQTIARALKLPYVAVVVNTAHSAELAVNHEPPSPHVTEWGSASSPFAAHGSLFTIPLTYQGEIIGELRLASRAPNEPFSPADQRLLNDLARQAGVAIHTVRLTADLQRSRERIVTAREEERRRLRRDLHDGLGTQLAALNLQAGVLRGLLTRDPTAADAAVVELRAELQAAIANIRRVVYALRPPALDEFGLVGACQELAHGLNGQSGTQFTVTAPTALPPLPAAVEVAAYRIAQEAITNVSKHARAQQCVIQITCVGAELTGRQDHPLVQTHHGPSHGGRAQLATGAASLGLPLLTLMISDDGRGLSAERHSGIGLHSMRERAAELSGTCVIEHVPTGGTRVVAQLPIANR